jgi:hypothetical protein
MTFIPMVIGQSELVILPFYVLLFVCFSVFPLIMAVVAIVVVVVANRKSK